MRRLSARLSASRRSRYAAPVVLLLALLTTGAVYNVTADRVLPQAQAREGEYDDDTVAAGRGLFLVGCASCHGQNGEGVTTKDDSQYGPSLVGVGAAAVDFQVGTGRMPMAYPAAQAPQKEKVYNDEEIEQLAAYVASLGPGPAIPEAERAEAVVRGGEFFRTNCTACHNFAASGGALPGGKYAPTLIGVDPRHIYEALITGPQQMPVFSDEVITPEQKRDVIAYIEQIDETPRYGGFSMGSVGPVSEGMFAWLAGIGGLVAFAIWIASHTARTARKGAQQ